MAIEPRRLSPAAQLVVTGTVSLAGAGGKPRAAGPSARIACWGSEPTPRDFDSVRPGAPWRHRATTARRQAALMFVDEPSVRCADIAAAVDGMVSGAEPARSVWRRERNHPAECGGNSRRTGALPLRRRRRVRATKPRETQRDGHSTNPCIMRVAPTQWRLSRADQSGRTAFAFSIILPAAAGGKSRVARPSARTACYDEPSSK